MGRLAMTAVVVAALCAACGGGGAAAGRGDATTLVLRRTGGIAGFDDTLTISPDGMAELTTRDGRRTRCRLGPEQRSRVAGVQWRDLRPASRGPRHSDAMTFVVHSGGHRVVLDADLPADAHQPAVDTIAALFAAAHAARGGDATGCRPS
jgi:hypothetical protein